MEKSNAFSFYPAQRYILCYCFGMPKKNNGDNGKMMNGGSKTLTAVGSVGLSGLVGLFMWFGQVINDVRQEFQDELLELKSAFVREVETVKDDAYRNAKERDENHDKVLERIENDLSEINNKLLEIYKFMGANKYGDER